MPIISYTSVEGVLTENQRQLLCQYLIEAVGLVLGEELKEQTTITVSSKETLLKRFDIELYEKNLGCQNAMLTMNPSELGLTPRQQSVLMHVLSCRTNKQIARELYITEQTVKEHVSAILSHFNVGNRVELIRYFANIKFSVN